jgi:hypothetical protein
MFDNNISNSSMIEINFSTTRSGFILNHFDNAVRVFTILVHLIYILASRVHRKFRSRSLLFLHHVNFINFLNSLHQMYLNDSAYVFNNNYSENLLNVNLRWIMCSLSETMCLTLKFLCMYSLVLLGMYRYFAVYHLNMYKKITKCSSSILIFIVFTWIVSILLGMAFKVGGVYLRRSRNRKAHLNCHRDEVSIADYDHFFYMIFLTIFANLIPTILIFHLYRKVLKKLRVLEDSINRDFNVRKRSNSSTVITSLNMNANHKTTQQPSKNCVKLSIDSNTINTNFKNETFLRLLKPRHSSNMSILYCNHDINIKKHHNFTKQILLLNVVIIFYSYSTTVWLSMKQIFLVKIYTDYVSLNKILDIFFLVMLSVAPIVSLFYFPWFKSLPNRRQSIITMQFK